MADYFMANGSEDGIIFAPGTGSVGYIKSGESMKRFGGWGWSLGDVSSATWFSKKSLERAMYETDSEEERKEFVKEVEEYFNLPLRELVWLVERRKIPRKELASFSFRLSEMTINWNEVAVNPFKESADYIQPRVSGIKRIYKNSGRVSVAGGTLQTGDFYQRMLKEKIPGVRLYYGYDIVLGGIMHLSEDLTDINMSKFLIYVA